MEFMYVEDWKDELTFGDMPGRRHKLHQSDVCAYGRIPLVYHAQSRKTKQGIIAMVHTARILTRT